MTRLNFCGFSLPTMRALFRSGDEAAIARIRDRLAADQPFWREDEHRGAMAVVERAIREGIPFPDVPVESYHHARAAGAMARDGQEWLITDAGLYNADALEDLSRRYGKFARPEIRALLRGLIGGVPLFGAEPDPEGGAYAAIGLEKLRSFRPGLADLLVQVEFRADKLGDDEGPEFARELGEWIDQIVDAGRDLWSCPG